MIECSGCLTWLHMSCVKVKRKNIPEFYYCDSCKSNGMLSPTNVLGTSTASSGEESGTPIRANGILNSNSLISPDGILYSTHQNQSSGGSSSTTTTMASTKPKKPKTVKKSSASSLMMNSSDNIKNNTTSDSKYLNKKSSNSSTVNGKLKKIRQTAKKVRPATASPPTTKGPAYSGISSIAAAASLTALSLNHHPVSSTSIVTNNNNNNNNIHSNGIGSSENSSASNVLNNNNIYTNNGSSEVMETFSGGENGESDKFSNMRLKLL